jgi:hypothetical protein
MGFLPPFISSWGCVIVLLSCLYGCVVDIMLPYLGGGLLEAMSGGAV